VTKTYLPDVDERCLNCGQPYSRHGWRGRCYPVALINALQGREYLPRLPSSVPAGRWLVHNHVRPTRTLGARGFRAWLVESETDGVELCACDWAPELGAHYRVRREAQL
jgi:hypothetical protein